jgi:hypothetical protein
MDQPAEELAASYPRRRKVSDRAVLLSYVVDA